MKKVLGTLILGAGLVVSLSASAAAVINPVVSGTSYDDTKCALLNEPVTLNLSKNVVGAFSCDVNTNAMKVATCHTAGFRSPTLTCAVIGTDDSTDPVTPIFNNAGCKAAGDVLSIPDFNGFAASSTGGTVANVVLGGNCDQSKVSGLSQLQ